MRSYQPEKIPKIWIFALWTVEKCKFSECLLDDKNTTYYIVPIKRTLLFSTVTVLKNMVRLIGTIDDQYFSIMNLITPKIIYTIDYYFHFFTASSSRFTSDTDHTSVSRQNLRHRPKKRSNRKVPARLNRSGSMS